ncbi:phosphatidylglycerophosphatase A [bacterium]|nr:phosphatidylglycerophosphatase A [bacterium]
MSYDDLLQKTAVKVATIGPVGKLPYFPGTWGSFLAVILWWIFRSKLSSPLYWLIILFVTLLGIYTSGRAERELGRDAHPIVIDELVGQWIALAACPKNIFAALAAFLIFRLLDIWKPFPINKSQEIRGGVGVVADDVLAGGLTAVVILAVRWIWFD